MFRKSADRYLGTPPRGLRARCRLRIRLVTRDLITGIRALLLRHAAAARGDRAAAGCREGGGGHRQRGGQARHPAVGEGATCGASALEGCGAGNGCPEPVAPCKAAEAAMAWEFLWEARCRCWGSSTAGPKFGHPHSRARKRARKARILTMLGASGSNLGRGDDVRGSDAIRF